MKFARLCVALCDEKQIKWFKDLSIKFMTQIKIKKMQIDEFRSKYEKIDMKNLFKYTC